MPHICAAVSTACRLLRCDASSLFIRGLHTVISLGVPITLIIKNSDLRNSLTGVTSPLYGVIYIAILLFSLSMYYTACLVNPGYVPKKPSQNIHEEEDSESEEGSMLKKESESARFCEFCEIEQPMRSRHCEDCKRCVQKFDHHCPWLDTCVGEGNHKYFWWFLFSKTSLIIWTIIITWRAVEHKASWEDWLMANIILAVVMFILVAAGFTVISLFSFHTYLMFTNATTWEVVSRSRITYLKHLADDYNPFHMGYCRNMASFLCRCTLHRWQELYAKHSTPTTQPV